MNSTSQMRPPQATSTRDHGDAIAPPVDVYENQDGLILVADMPGVLPESVDVHLEKGQLTIHAKRRDTAGAGTLLAAEHRPRDYVRIFSVPQSIDPTKIDAQLNLGVLRLHLPKSEALKPRRIEVKQG